MLMRAATVVQVLQDLFMFYCMFYFTCDRSFTQILSRGRRCANTVHATDDDGSRTAYSVRVVTPSERYHLGHYSSWFQ